MDITDIFELVILKSNCLTSQTGLICFLLCLIAFLTTAINIYNVHMKDIQVVCFAISLFCIRVRKKIYKTQWQRTPSLAVKQGTNIWCHYLIKHITWHLQISFYKKTTHDHICTMTSITSCRFAHIPRTLPAGNFLPLPPKRPCPTLPLPLSQTILS